MKAIQSSLYTNVILTAIAVLLAVLAFQPAFRVTTPAVAQFIEDEPASSPFATDQARADRNSRASFGSGSEQLIANATREVAAANREIAKAMRDAAKDEAEAMRSLAQAIARLSEI